MNPGNGQSNGQTVGVFRGILHSGIPRFPHSSSLNIEHDVSRHLEAENDIPLSGCRSRVLAEDCLPCTSEFILGSVGPPSQICGGGNRTAVNSDILADAGESSTPTRFSALDPAPYISGQDIPIRWVERDVPVIASSYVDARVFEKTGFARSNHTPNLVLDES